MGVEREKVDDADEEDDDEDEDQAKAEPEEQEDGRAEKDLATGAAPNGGEGGNTAFLGTRSNESNRETSSSSSEGGERGTFAFFFEDVEDEAGCLERGGTAQGADRFPRRGAGGSEGGEVERGGAAQDFFRPAPTALRVETFSCSGPVGTANTSNF